MDEDFDAPQVLSAKEWAQGLDRARADVSAGRVIEIEIDTLCDEIDAEAHDMERRNQRPRAPSPA